MGLCGHEVVGGLHVAAGYAAFVHAQQADHGVGDGAHGVERRQGDGSAVAPAVGLGVGGTFLQEASGGRGIDGWRTAAVFTRRRGTSETFEGDLKAEEPVAC